MRRFTEPEVAAAFAAYPPRIRRRMLALRQLIFETAAETDGVGPVEESLRWGEPAYLTSESKSGSTVRIYWKPRRPGQVAVYFHCKTNLVGTFRRMFPKLRFEGDRAIVLREGESLPSAELRRCVELALTHHRRSKKKPRQR